MSRAMMICMLAASLAVRINCFAQTPRAIAQRLYYQLDQADSNRDLKRELGFYDSSFIWIDAQHKRVAYAEWRVGEEQAFSRVRRSYPRTTVNDVQLVAGRMVVTYKSEKYYELLQRGGWAPWKSKETGEDTWERKGGQWKLVRSTTFGVDVEKLYDPDWAKLAIRAYEKSGEICLDPPCYYRTH